MMKSAQAKVSARSAAEISSSQSVPAALPRRRRSPARSCRSREPAATNTDKRRGKGYEETAHVRNYYRTTKV